MGARILLVLAVGLVSPFLLAEDATEVTRERIAKLIAQLGADDFDARETASRELLSVGLAAESALQRAATADDLELKLRAEQLLTKIAPLRMQHLFKKSMAGPWRKALAEGRLVGPLLGAVDVGAPEQPESPGREPAAKTSKGELEQAVKGALQYLSRSQTRRPSSVT